MKSRNRKRTIRQGKPQTDEAKTVDVAVAYLRALRKAADQKSDIYTHANGVRTMKVTMDYLSALRREVGRHIDPEKAEVDWAMRYIVDPYDDDPNLPGDLQCTGRAYFARCPGTDVWICFDDLPDCTSDKLLEKHEHKLAFPAGL
jgi:hypothetical protein